MLISLFPTPFDHFHFHPTLELKSRVILRRLCHIKPGRNNCCNRHIPVLAISLPRPRETGCLESISIMMVMLWMEIMKIISVIKPQSSSPRWFEWKGPTSSRGPTKGPTNQDLWWPCGCGYPHQYPHYPHISRYNRHMSDNADIRIDAHRQVYPHDHP